MKELMDQVLRALEQKQEIVLATIIASQGSTPRGTGSSMLVKRGGEMTGTIGGGAVEYKALQTSLEALEKKESCIKQFSLTRSQAADIGMVCGGDVTIYFQYMNPENEAVRKSWQTAREAVKAKKDAWLVLELTKKQDWNMEVCTAKQGLPENRAVTKTVEGRSYYIEPLLPEGTVYIFGGGHVARELVPVLSCVGFSCVVMDDRKEFANRDRFPLAKQVIVGDMEHISSYVEIKSRDYVCIMTRGHQYDYYVQRQALALKPCYIGVMGSRNKIRVVTEKLLEDGFCLEEIASCHMPIGTEIKAETPAEIAISIAGELIAVRAGARKQQITV